MAYFPGAGLVHRR